MQPRPRAGSSFGIEKDLPALGRAVRGTDPRTGSKSHETARSGTAGCCLAGHVQPGPGRRDPRLGGGTRARHGASSAPGADPPGRRGAGAHVPEPRGARVVGRHLRARLLAPRGDRRGRHVERGGPGRHAAVRAVRARPERVRQHLRARVRPRRSDALGAGPVRPRRAAARGRGRDRRGDGVPLAPELRDAGGRAGGGGGRPRAAEEPPPAPPRVLRARAPVRVRPADAVDPRGGGRRADRGGCRGGHGRQRRDLPRLPEPHAHRVAHRRAVRRVRHPARGQAPGVGAPAPALPRAALPLGWRPLVSRAPGSRHRARAGPPRSSACGARALPLLVPPGSVSSLVARQAEADAALAGAGGLPSARELSAEREAALREPAWLPRLRPAAPPARARSTRSAGLGARG